MESVDVSANILLPASFSPSLVSSSFASFLLASCLVCNLLVFRPHFHLYFLEETLLPYCR